MNLNRNVIKVIQLILTLSCLFLHLQSRTLDSLTELVSIGAYIGFLIIIVGYFIIGNTKYSVEVYYTFVGFALFSASAYLNFHKFYKAYDSNEKTYGLIKCGLSILNAVFFLIESVLVWRD